MTVYINSYDLLIINIGRILQLEKTKIET